MGDPINKGISNFGLGHSQTSNRNSNQNIGLKEESFVDNSKISYNNNLNPNRAIFSFMNHKVQMKSSNIVPQSDFTSNKTVNHD